MLLDRRCPPPPNIAHQKKWMVYRKNRKGCFVPTTNPNYKFGQLLKYDCEAGYELHDPTVTHYCTARNSWTNVGKAICTSKRSSNQRHKSQCFLHHKKLFLPQKSCKFYFSITFRQSLLKKKVSVFYLRLRPKKKFFKIISANVKIRTMPDSSA